MHFPRLRIGLAVATATLFAGCGGGASASAATSEEICHAHTPPGTQASIALQEKLDGWSTWSHDHPDWIGGTWIDTSNAHLVIALVPGTNRAALDEAVRATHVDPSVIEYRHMKRSFAELQKESRNFAETEAPKLRAEGYQVSGVGSPQVHNLNCVGVVKLTDAGRRVLEARYPTMRFVAEGPFSG